MRIERKAQAGTVQSSDLMVFLEPQGCLTIEIESTVKQQFEHLIRARIEAILHSHGVTTGKVRVSDRGASTTPSRRASRRRCCGPREPEWKGSGSRRSSRVGGS